MPHLDRLPTSAPPEGDYEALERAAALHERAAVFYESLGDRALAAEQRERARRCWARGKSEYERAADLPTARERDELERSTGGIFARSF